VLVGIGYFLVWTIIGAAVFAIGVAVSTTAMTQPAVARAVPIAAGAVVLLAGYLQFTQWKLRHLACCRPALVPARTLTEDAATAYRYGVRLGLHCAKCCAGLIAVLLVVGVMDLVAMAVIAAAITIERVLPAGERVARIMGVIIVATGLLLIARI
jgi:predicted metal-binding membrane protein